MASNLTPVPPDKIGETHAWREWFSRIYLLLNGTASGSVPINHNALSGIQGGNSTESYHLTLAQESGLTGSTDTTLHYHSSDRDLANATGILALNKGGSSTATAPTAGQVLTATSGTTATWQAASPTLVTAEIVYGNGTTTPAQDANLTWDSINKAITVNGIRIHAYGVQNIFIGSGSGNFTTTGVGNNVGIGDNCLSNLTTGSQNLAFGTVAMQQTLTAVSNSAFGYAALENSNGYANIGIGTSAGAGISSGQRNVCIGNGTSYAGNADFTTLIGCDAGWSISYSDSCTLIGRASHTTSGTPAYQNTFGANVLGDTDHQTFLGDASNTAWVPGATGMCDVGRTDRRMNRAYHTVTNDAGFTVATLPAGTVGDRCYVTNALAPTFGAAVAGGGAVVIPVFHNGTTWIVG